MTINNPHGGAQLNSTLAGNYICLAPGRSHQLCSVLRSAVTTPPVLSLDVALLAPLRLPFLFYGRALAGKRTASKVPKIKANVAIRTARPIVQASTTTFRPAKSSCLLYFPRHSSPREPSSHISQASCASDTMASGGQRHLMARRICPSSPPI